MQEATKKKNDYTDLYGQRKSNPYATELSNVLSDIQIVEMLFD